ncbi:bacillithiol biosynthesis cysteine-adding enzyme BshC [Terrilactibacillus sp. BCM23-1]|uniref:Putative cysteine ligase BshC n=1 Tax=Terrilactibacillus tamarindi TaxID=2599694 RepID=A0A6N8CS35_9BACI|nr:bacillithiol biosynthesis cysteine-adding enzyme BshC [Terrilactibacillus tamarindi]MTT32007.1 bacillithiol biosynthesis cysteine-adding enzyme BshC [Terrilactibacillus tamarindi]
MNVRTIENPPSSKLVEDYTQEKDHTHCYFDYQYKDQESYQQRLNDIQHRDYQREELSLILTEFNQKYTDDRAVFHNIEKLRHSETVVVVGGQQPGLLTGPALTIHKCLSIIKLAKQQEIELGIPVIPLFWIAGEDHDFDEINHLFSVKDQKIKKYIYRNQSGNKTSVSKLPLDQEALSSWIEDVFESFGETEYTKSLLEIVQSYRERSTSVVDFFAFLIHHLFSSYGLILMNSADPKVRQIEKSYFRSIFQKRSEINKGVLSQLRHLKEAGYQINLDQAEGNINLFYEWDRKRELLSESEGILHDKHYSFNLEPKHFEEMIEEHPERISNNVVTRPLMQELLLPTLAFVAGPGEIAYWSSLRPAFHALDLTMPPIVPRVHITLLPRDIKKWIETKQLSLEDICSGKMSDLSNEWLKSQHSWDVDQIINQFRHTLIEAHKPVSELALEISQGLKSFSEKNLAYFNYHIDRMKIEMNKKIETAYRVELNRFKEIELALYPNSAPQERTYSIFYYLNQYGLDLIKILMEHDYSNNGKQHVVEL